MAADGLYDFRYCTRCGDIELLDRVTRLCPSCTVRAFAERTSAPHYRVLAQTRRQPWQPSSLHRFQRTLLFRKRIAGHAILLGVTAYLWFQFIPLLADYIHAGDHIGYLDPLRTGALWIGSYLALLVVGWALSMVYGRR